MSVDLGAAIVRASQELPARIGRMDARRRLWLGVGATFLIAMVGLLVWSAERTEWRVLFSGLESRDLQQVSQELGAAGISFQMTQDGSGIEVPAELLDKARMEVAAKGMPQSGRLGFELFDKPNWLGSEFDEKVNYQRALEGELEHTIATLEAVRSARVHLVMSQEGLFSSEDKAAKATVVLKLRPGALGAGQADSIRSLVAGAVENLRPEEVTLVDADGKANLRPQSRDSLQADQERRMEADLVSMLEPLAGHDNVRATVKIDYDDSREERSDEVYDPTQTATLSMQRNEQGTATQQIASGVPGTASNSPAGATAGSVQGSKAASAPGAPPLLQTGPLPVYPAGGAGGQMVRQENGSYAVTKHTVRVEKEPGRIGRVTAAVLINDRAASSGAGKSQHQDWKPRSQEEMRQLEQLAQAAVGFNVKRGDQVVVENVSFESNHSQLGNDLQDSRIAQLKELGRSQAGLLHAGQIALVGLVLTLFVLRPLSRQLIATLAFPGETAREKGMREMVGTTDRAELPLTPEEDSRLDSGAVRRPARALLDQVSEHVKKEPIQSAKVLERWIQSTEVSR